MKNKMKLLFAAVAAAVALPLAVQAYQPTELTVPISSSLVNVTNQTIYTNNSATFSFPNASAPARLVANINGVYTNNITVGINVASDPNGTNFTTSLPMQVTFVPVTNSLGTTQVLAAYLAATNFDAAVKGRFDYISTASPGLSLTGLKFEFNY
jgi:hypothetical protein